MSSTNTYMKNDFLVYIKNYEEYFTDGKACRTSLGVKSLPRPATTGLRIIAFI